MKYKIIILMVLIFVSPANAKRLAPKDVDPIVTEHKIFSVPHWGLSNNRKQNGGYIEVRDKATNNILWELKIYDINYDENIETDIQDVLIIETWLEGNLLHAKDEKGNVHIIDINTKRLVTAYFTYGILTTQKNIKTDDIPEKDAITKTDVILFGIISILLLVCYVLFRKHKANK